MHCTKIWAEFEFGVIAPECGPNVALGYDVGKISAGCLVHIRIVCFIHAVADTGVTAPHTDS